MHALRKQNQPVAHVPIEGAGTGIVPVPAINKLQSYPIATLNELVARHFRATGSTNLAVHGSYLPFLYVLISTLILPPHNKAVVVIDMDHQFDPIGPLGCSPVSELDGDLVENPTDAASVPSLSSHSSARVRSQNLQHIHLYQPPRDARLADVMAQAERHMLYGSHASKSREWWGTMIIRERLSHADDSTALGSTGARSALLSRPVIHAGWKGWLRIGKEPVPAYRPDRQPTLEEHDAELARRNEILEENGWLANSEWGGFIFSLNPREG